MYWCKSNLDNASDTCAQSRAHPSFSATAGNFLWNETAVSPRYCKTSTATGFVPVGNISTVGTKLSLGNDSSHQPGIWNIKSLSKSLRQGTTCPRSGTPSMCGQFSADSEKDPRRKDSSAKALSNFSFDRRLLSVKYFSIRRESATSCPRCGNFVHSFSACHSSNSLCNLTTSACTPSAPFLARCISWGQCDRWTSIAHHGCHKKPGEILVLLHGTVLKSLCPQATTGLTGAKGIPFPTETTHEAS